MIDKIKRLIKKVIENRKWNLNLYYDGVKIKKVKVYKNELEDLKNKTYEVKVFFKKQLFKSNIVQIIVSPVVLLYTNESKREVCVGVVIETGQKL